MATRKGTLTQSSSKPSLVWYKGITTKEEFEKHLLNSYNIPVLVQLVKLIEDELIDLDKKERSPNQFETPSWAFNQAYLNGRKNAYQGMLDLLAFVERK